MRKSVHLRIRITEEQSKKLEGKTYYPYLGGVTSLRNNRFPFSIFQIRKTLGDQDVTIPTPLIIIHPPNFSTPIPKSLPT